MIPLVVALVAAVASALLCICRGIQGSEDPTGEGVAQFLMLVAAIIGLAVGIAKYEQLCGCEIPAERPRSSLCLPSERPRSSGPATGTTDRIGGWWLSNPPVPDVSPVRD